MSAAPPPATSDPALPALYVCPAVFRCVGRGGANAVFSIASPLCCPLTASRDKRPVCDGGALAALTAHVAAVAPSHLGLLHAGALALRIRTTAGTESAALRTAPRDAVVAATLGPLCGGPSAAPPLLPVHIALELFPDVVPSLVPAAQSDRQCRCSDSCDGVITVAELLPNFQCAPQRLLGLPSALAPESTSGHLSPLSTVALEVKPKRAWLDPLTGPAAADAHAHAHAQAEGAVGSPRVAPVKSHRCRYSQMLAFKAAKGPPTPSQPPGPACPHHGTVHRVATVLAGGTVTRPYCPNAFLRGAPCPHCANDHMPASPGPRQPPPDEHTAAGIHWRTPRGQAVSSLIVRPHNNLRVFAAAGPRVAHVLDAVVAMFVADASGALRALCGLHDAGPDVEVIAALPPDAQSMWTAAFYAAATAADASILVSAAEVLAGPDRQALGMLFAGRGTAPVAAGLWTMAAVPVPHVGIAVACNRRDVQGVDQGALARIPDAAAIVGACAVLAVVAVADLDCKRHKSIARYHAHDTAIVQACLAAQTVSTLTEK